MTLDSEAGLREAYRVHAGELFGVALRGLADRGAAEDAVQETFLRAWRAAGRYDPELGSERTWLFAILRSVIIDTRRRAAVRPAVASDPDAASGAATAPGGMDEAILGWQAEEALRRLSPQHRAVLVEIRLRGRSMDDLAAELGIPVGTVKSRVHYALRAFRLALEEQGAIP